MAVAKDGILWPIRFDSTSYVLRLTLNGVAEDLAFPATGALTTTRNYWMSGDGQADGATNNGQGDLLDMLKSTLETHSEHTGGETWTVEDVSTDGSNTLRIKHSTHAFTIQWTSGTTLDGSLWGYDTSSDDVSDGTNAVDAPNQSSGIWFPDSTRQNDSRDRQPYVGAVTMTTSGLVRVSRSSVPNKTRQIQWGLLDKSRALAEYEPTTRPDGSFEAAWDGAISLGYAWRMYDDITSRTSSSYGLYKTTSLADPLSRDGQAIFRWRVSLSATKVA